MPQLKTAFIIIGSIGVLTALMLVFLQPPGQSRSDPGETRNGDHENEVSSPPDSPPPAATSTEPAVKRLHNRIDAASSTEQFRAAADAILNDAPPEQLTPLMARLLKRWAAHDISEALQFAAGLTGEAGDEDWLKHAVVAAGRVDFARTVEWLEDESLQEGQHQSLLAALYQGAADKVPEQALEHIDSLQDDELRRNMVHKLVGLWAQQDAAAALGWLGSRVPLSEPLRQLHESLFSRFKEDHFDRAGELIQGMPVSERKRQLARDYASELAQRDIPAALKWARGLNAPESYRMALSASYEAWLRAESDKSVILQELLGESDSGFRNHLINEVALDIAANDPAELGDLVSQLPESAQGDVTEKAVRFWQERAPDEAAAWVSRLESGPAKDRGSAVLVDHFTREGDRDRVLSLLNNIEDEQVRHDAAKRATSRWYRQSPDEAREMLEQMSFLNDAEREAIVSDLE